jgi:hypothetical protein
LKNLYIFYTVFYLVSYNFKVYTLVHSSTPAGNLYKSLTKLCAFKRQFWQFRMLLYFYFLLYPSGYSTFLFYTHFLQLSPGLTLHISYHLIIILIKIHYKRVRRNLFLQNVFYIFPVLSRPTAEQAKLIDRERMKRALVLVGQFFNRSEKLCRKTPLGVSLN